MGTSLRVAAAGALLCAALAGCARSTDGTVAMTTEAGPALTTSTRAPSPTAARPSAPPTGGTSTPSVPAPPNATTMLCSEYSGLDPATQRAVIDEILAQEDNPLSTGGADVAKTLADAVCQFLPSSPVNQVLLGGGPP